MELYCKAALILLIAGVGQCKPSSLGSDEIVEGGSRPDDVPERDGGDVCA